MDVIAKTRLRLNGASLPGSLVLQIISAMSPADEIAPDGQAEFFNDHETQMVDAAIKSAFSLLEDGRRLGPDVDASDFLSKVQTYGLRVATTLRDFSNSLVKYEFEPDLAWRQPRQPRLRTRLNTSELAHISQPIASRKLEREPTTVRGVLRTVSEISAWQVEIDASEIVRIEAKKIAAEDTATLCTGMVLAVAVTVTEEGGPAGEGTAKFSAISFKVLDA